MPLRTRSLTWVAAVTAALTLSSIDAGAQVKAGPELRANTYTTGSQQRPSLAVEPDGDFIVTWTSTGQDGSSYGVVRPALRPVGDAARQRVPGEHLHGGRAVLLARPRSTPRASSSWSGPATSRTAAATACSASATTPRATGSARNSRPTPTPSGIRATPRVGVDATGGFVVVVAERGPGRQRQRHICASLRLLRQCGGYRVPGQHLHDRRAGNAEHGHAARTAAFVIVWESPGRLRRRHFRAALRRPGKSPRRRVPGEHQPS